jgi:hypothetical protein
MFNNILANTRILKKKRVYYFTNIYIMI